MPSSELTGRAQLGHWVEGLLRFLRPLELTTGMMLECIGGLDIDDSFTLTTRAFRCTFLDRFRHALVVLFHFPFPHRSDTARGVYSDL